MFFKLYTETISREVIDETFLIKFDDFKERIISFKNLSNDQLMNSVHWLCIDLLKNYFLNTNNYLKRCNNELELDSINLYLWKYAFENFKLLLNVDYDYNKIISVEEAVKNFNDINCKNDENSTFERDYNNLKTKLREFRNCDDNRLNKDFLLNAKCNIKRKYNIYKDLSTVCIFTIDNWEECAYNKKDKLKEDIYIKDGKFLSSFLTLNNLNNNDIYYFERIHNINFKLSLYNHINQLNKDNLYFSENEIIKVAEAFSPILYLPNVFNNTNLLSSLMNIYIRYYKNYDIEGFRKSVKMLCNDIVEYYLPLYNSVFFRILNFYCETLNINIKDITKEVYSNMYSNPNIYYFLLKEKMDQGERLKKFEKIIEKGNNKQKKINKKTYYLITRVINDYFNFDRLSNEGIVNNINILHRRVLKDIRNISDYQLSLRDFILKINTLKLEASDI
ncbi:hypothetical protein H8S10_14265 [Clostridium sp. NSJ-49]|uniref:hypothetical protein n=1 Tax=Clostridium sp. NSJ-49 TaxID=2763034 RepID=UPI00164A74D1|nr:hypothetical protein [Clostridium sp. NSJ-49]MBC5626613.1 hypothetical protein [Clostridium sp. NSJ-49]